VTIPLVCATTVIVVVTIHIAVVTIEIVTTTILFCWGHMKKTYCRCNKVIYSVWRRAKMETSSEDIHGLGLTFLGIFLIPTPILSCLHWACCCLSQHFHPLLILYQGYATGFCQLWSHGEKDFVASAKRSINIPSANPYCCGDNFNCYNNNIDCYRNNSVVTVTNKIVTPTILVCCGYIKKTFCWGNKVFFSVRLRRAIKMRNPHTYGW